MIAGAIFDVDGTLLDSMGIWKDAGIRYLKLQNIRADTGLSEILFPMSLEEGAAYLQDAYHLSQETDEIITGVLNIVRDFYYREAPLKKGVPTFLQALKEQKIPLAVATSSDRELIEAAFRRLGIDDYFRQIFTCCELGTGKDSPLIYEKAAEFLGTAADQTFVFEDALHAILTAKNAGFCTVGVYDEQSAKDNKEIIRLSDYYLSDLTNFTKFWEFAAKH